MLPSRDINSAFIPWNSPHPTFPMSPLEKVLYYVNFTSITIVWIIFIIALATLPSLIIITLNFESETTTTSSKVFLIVFPILASVSTVLFFFFAKHSHRLALIRVQMNVEQAAKVFVIQRMLARYLSIILNLLMGSILVNIMLLNGPDSQGISHITFLFLLFLCSFIFGLFIAIDKIKKVIQN